MGLLSIFKRTGASSDASATSGAGETGDAVQQARTRARRRLIGAAVLLVIGVIGFPLVFETRPRPIPVDIPIEIPKKDGAPALVMPPARPAAAAPTPAVPPAPVAVAPAPADEDVITESRADAGHEIASRERAASAPEKAGPKAAPKTATAAVDAAPKSAVVPHTEPPRKSASTDAASAAALETARKSAASAPARTAAAADGQRAKALLDAKPAPSADGARFVVQVGAFAEADSARETRLKVEKLGLKTYTQVAQTPAGSRIRVRVGPFGSRAAADAALAKARAAGLTAVVLTL